MSTSIYDVLRTVAKEQTLVSIHTNPDNWSSCSVGYVHSISRRHVRLRAVNRYGEDAGYEVRKLEEIFKIDFGGKYEHKVEHLRRNQENILHEVTLGKGKGQDLILGTLKQAQDLDLVVVIWGHDPGDSLVGFVEYVDDNGARIRVLDEFGMEDGYSTIKSSEITAVDCNTRSEQVLRFLYKTGQPV
ncbi:MAG: hypothetical protein ACT4QB_10925 [Gammaproteobacteria bacterium]